VDPYADTNPALPAFDPTDAKTKELRGEQPAEPAIPKLLPRAGGRVGAYTIHGELGRGGMGAVFRARHDDGGEVALKVCMRHLADVSLKRFEREGALAATLDHPGLVRVLEAGQADGFPYIACELIPEAKNLVAYGRPLDHTSKAALVRDAAAALGHAHARAVVHRDVKPDNLLVDGSARVRVVDFGLALTDESERLTRTGVTVGTPAYMSPEQTMAKRDTVGPPTDVWALGAVLYELLTDHLPFVAESLPELGTAIRAANPTPPRRLDPTIPAALEAVCLKALSARPEDRYPSGTELANALTEALAPAAEARGRGVGLLAGAAGLSLVVMLGLVALASRSRPADAASPPPSSRPAPPSPSASEAASAPTTPLPAWVTELEPSERPPLPLPEGIGFAGPGEFVCHRDGSLLVWVPAGRFHMGDAAGDATEQPVHEVAVAGFFMGKHEVTWAQYRRFCQATGATPGDDAIHGHEVPFQARDAHPVFNVSWEDARAYCAWAGLTLPNEAEWEYAARGTASTHRYPWGERFDPASPAALNLGDASTGALAPVDFGRLESDYDDGHPFLAPVGQFPAGASPFGCLDMAGNVWEWTADAFAPYDAGDDAAEPGPNAARVTRGGSWDNPAEFCRATARGGATPDTRANYLGFRVALRP
jgi:serine/threonine-protein kinase